MAALLQYTLGLATSNFLNALGPVGASVKGLAGSLVSVGAVMNGVFSQFERGAGLEHLSRRTGETVSDLYEMEKGFKAVGLSADSLPHTLLMMEKALGGFNEMGEPTKDIFAGLG